MDGTRCFKLVALSNVHSDVIVEVLTDYFPIGKHEVLLDTKWQSYMDKVGVETARHFLLHFSAFAKLKFKHLGSYIFGEHFELAGIHIDLLMKCIIISRLFLIIRVSFDPYLRILGITKD